MMNRTLNRWGCVVSILAVQAMAACASGGSFADVARTRGQLAALEDSLPEIGFSLAGDLMSDDVEIITFLYSTIDKTWERRDTVRGVFAAESWLENLRATATLEGASPFSAGDILRCDGAAIQNGTYFIRDPGLPGGGERRFYRSLWIPTPEGGWALERLLLDPDKHGRSSELAEECVSRRDLGLEDNRWNVSIAGLQSGLPTVGVIVDEMIENEWNLNNPRDPRLQGYPRTDTDQRALTLSLEYRLNPRWGVKGLYVSERSSIVRGITLTERPNVTVRDQVAAVLAGWTFGVLRVGLGPAVATVDYHWDSGKLVLYNVPPPSFDSETLFGAIGDLSLAMPVTRWFRPFASVRYELFPNANIPGYLDLEAFSVPFSRATIGGGVAIVF